MADSVKEAFGKAVGSLGTVWVHIGTPNLTGDGSPSSPVDAGASAPGSENITQVLGYVMWISIAVAVLSLIILGAIVATRMRTGEGLASAGKVGLVLAAVVLMSAASALVAALLPSGPTSSGGAVLFLQSSLWWYMGAAAVASVIIGATRMAWEQRAEPGRETVKSLLTLVVVAGAGVTVVGLLVAAADSFSVWLINGSLGCDVTAGGSSTCFGSNMLKLLALTTSPASNGLGSLLVIILGLIAVLAAVFQILLMVARGGMLVILTGILPLSASFTNTEMGKSWFRKCIAWLVAFILYKPAAAIVYAAAFQLAGTDVFTDDGTGLLSVLTGLMLMIIALFAMPALMRFVTPMVGAIAGGAGGALGVGALAALPSGAAALGRLGTGSGGGYSESAGPGGPSESRDPTGGTSGGDGSPAQSPGPPRAGDGAGAASSSGAATAGTGAASSSAAGAGGGAAAAGAAAGPIGMAAGAAMSAGKSASSAAQSLGEQSTGEGGGPDGSR